MGFADDQAHAQTAAGVEGNDSPTTHDRVSEATGQCAVAGRIRPRPRRDMRTRWCVAGLLRVESRFRRVKGRRALPALMKVLEQLARKGPPGIGRGIAREWLAASSRLGTTAGKRSAPGDRAP